MPTAVRCCWKAPSGRLRKDYEDRRERLLYQRRRGGSSARGSVRGRDIRLAQGSSLFFLQNFDFLWRAKSTLLLRFLLGHLEVDADVHVVADHHAAAIQIGVPLYAVVHAIDGSGGIEGHASFAPGIFYRAGRTFDVENNLLGYAV